MYASVSDDYFRTLQVPVNWPDGTALHGLAAWERWDVVAVTEDEPHYHAAQASSHGQHEQDHDAAGEQWAQLNRGARQQTEG